MKTSSQKLHLTIRSDVHAKAKKQAALERRSMASLFEIAMIAYLSERGMKPEQRHQLR